MIKRYFNASIVYASLALAGGVFFREFTKYTMYTGETNLAFIHTHYFMLGMFFFLALALLEQAFAFSELKPYSWVTVYHRWTQHHDRVPVPAGTSAGDAGRAFARAQWCAFRRHPASGISCSAQHHRAADLDSQKRNQNRGIKEALR